MGAAAGSGPVDAGGVWEVLVALGLVVAAIFAVAWLMRRLQPGMVAGPVSMRILGALALGPRERLLLVDVAGTQVLLGVTPTQITRLLEIEEELALSQQPASSDFAARLRQIIGAGRQA